MKREDRRHANLLAYLAKYNEDVDFLKDVNDRLSRHPDYTEGKPISEAFLSQLKHKKRNIGPSLVGKLEAGLGLEEGALDFPLPEEWSRILEAQGLDAEFESLLNLTDGQQDAEVVEALAQRCSPRDAAAYARIFLDRVEAGTGAA